jgi:hypothetical protein
VLESFLHLPPLVASLVALPAFPQGVNSVRIQRTVVAMVKFDFLGGQFKDYDVRNMIYQG